MPPVVWALWAASMSSRPWMLGEGDDRHGAGWPLCTISGSKDSPAPEHLSFAHPTNIY